MNTAMVYTYYKIGCYIVEYEQQGSNRASYGRKVLANLSAHLTETYGKGWSVTTLNNCRKFYSAYRISCATHTKSTKEEIVCNAYEIPKFTLSWNHYQILMRIANLEERNFYEIEAQQQGWDYRLYLPDKALLQAKVKEWITEFEENEELMKHESNE